MPGNKYVHTEGVTYRVNLHNESVPYAPGANVISLLRRRRDGRLPETLTLQELERLGIPQGSAPRVLVALQFLGLVDDEGRQTASFQRLGKVSDDEYPGVLAEIIRSAYPRVFDVVDPAEASDVQLSDAFRGFQPEAQRPRMITLFQALSREAGIVPGGPVEPRFRRARATTPRSVGTESIQKKPSRVSTRQMTEGVPGGIVTQPAADYRLLVTLLDQLPTEGRWTRERRDRWLQAVTANLDLLVEIIEPSSHPAPSLGPVDGRDHGQGVTEREEPDNVRA